MTARAELEAVDQVVERDHVSLAEQEAARQERSQGMQSRSKAAVPHAFRQAAGRHSATARADQSMPSVFRDLDARLGNRADLMSAGC